MQLDWGDALREFELYARAEKSAATARYYMCQLRQWVRWCEECSPPVLLSACRARHLYEYIEHRKAVGRSAGTTFHDALCVRTLFRWLARTRRADDPMRDVRVHQPPEPRVKHASQDEMAQLGKAIVRYFDARYNPNIRYSGREEVPFLRTRTLAVVAIFVELGVRFGELAALHLCDYDREARLLRVEREKKRTGPRQESLPITGDLAELIDDWLKRRPRHVPSPHLFVDLHGSPLSLSAHAKLLKRILDRAGMDHAISHHTLRRYAITRLAQSGFWAAVRIAGHVDPKTTRRYIHTSEASMRAAIEGANAVGDILSNRRADVRRSRIV